MRVLLLDDDPHLREVLSDALKAKGFECIAVETGGGRQVSFATSGRRSCMNGPLEKWNLTQAEYFKDIVGTVREPLLVLDKDLRVLAANRSFYKTFKMKKKETLGNQIYELGNRQWDIPAMRALLETILPDKAVFTDYEVEHDFPFIGKRSLLLNARRIPPPPKEAHWILLAFEDITGRRRLEQSLQASKERIFSISVTSGQESEDVNLYALDVTGHMKAEEGLRLLAPIIESNNDAIIGKTLEGTILTWNPGAEKQYGYPADEVIGKSVSIIVPPDKADELAEILKRIGRGERFENFETERLTKDGRRLNVSLTISPILDEGGKVIGASTIAHDITERKKAEAELILANKELIFQNEEKEKRAAELVVANRELVYQNEEKEKRAAELVVANKELVYQNEEKEKRAAELVVANKELVFQNKEKEKRAAELAVANKELAFQKKKIRKLNTELETIVEKRTAQLQETIELNQKMIETSSLGIFACRADGPCVIANPAVARISGAPLDTMLQLNFRELESWKKNGLFDKAEAALATGKEQRVESHLTAIFGKDAWLNYYFTTFTSNGELHFLMMVEDITERKQADQALQQRTAQLEAANKELEAFSYSVSHDLRSPLRAIDGFSRILLEEYAPQLPAEASRYLDLVRSNTQKMGELVDDLLAFSRLGRQPLKKQSLSPEGIVRESLEDLSPEQAGRQVEIVLGALPDCEADPALLKQVFVNLISNALKFTRQRDVAHIEIGSEEKDGRPAYYVRDNGVGFDMQYVGKLFGVFQRLHRAEDYEGTGVGLAIVQRIVSRHGGRAWAEAELDKGATFYFTLEGGESDDHE
jgi:PAS domain S-box-containing protein